MSGRVQSEILDLVIALFQELGLAERLDCPPSHCRFGRIFLIVSGAPSFSWLVEPTRREARVSEGWRGVWDDFRNWALKRRLKRLDPLPPASAFPATWNRPRQQRYPQEGLQLTEMTLLPVSGVVSDGDRHWEVRMIRKMRGRPKDGSEFVEDCLRIDATTLLAKSRGFRASGEGQRSGRLDWHDGTDVRTHDATLWLQTTPQSLGGVRRWWRCPCCGRRCGVLLAVTPESPIACRRCHRARLSR